MSTRSFTNNYWMIPGINKSSKSDVSKTYVDNKFNILSSDLNTKVNKIGDTFSGNVDLRDYKITSSHVPLNEDDLVNKKYVDSLRGVTHGVSQPVDVGGISLNSKLNLSGGTMTGDLNLSSNKVTSSYIPRNDNDLINKAYLDEVAAHRLGDDDMRIIMNNLSLKVSKGGDTMTGRLDMGNNKITSWHTPEHTSDLINKKYLSLRHVFNNAGFIPELYKNTGNCSGFICSSSSEVSAFPTYFAFCSWKTHWTALDKTNAWIQIQCPQAVRIHKFALTGRGNGMYPITKWKLEASLNGTIWATLYSGYNKPLNGDVQFFSVATSPLAAYYRLTIIEGDNPALSYFQLFSCDYIEIPVISEIATDIM